MALHDNPTLADDEAKLALYANQLADAFADVAAPWLRRLVDDRQPGLASDPAVAASLDQEASRVADELRGLLQMDIADQPSGPLEVLRRAVQLPTAILAARDVAPRPRDEFSERNFPDDIYALTPASFADVDPALHEPGLVWGAAKAHVHLRRRREGAASEQTPSTERQVLVLSVDLMDRSKIAAAFPAATMVRSTAKLAEMAADADLVIVDLARFGDPDGLAELGERVVAFGSHVDDEVLNAAQAAGAEALPRSVFFRRLTDGSL